MIEFGDKVKDLITKMEGVVTGKASYITGCDQYLIQPVNKDKVSKPKSSWFDENRLKKIGVDKDAKKILKQNTGADMEAPIK